MLVGDRRHSGYKSGGDWAVEKWEAIDMVWMGMDEDVEMEVKKEVEARKGRGMGTSVEGIQDIRREFRNKRRIG